MEQKVKQTNEKNRIRHYRCWLMVLLLVVLLLAGWYCMDSYRQSITPKEGTLVDSGRRYERKV